MQKKLNNIKTDSIKVEKERSKPSLIKLIKNYFVKDKRNYKLFFTTYSKGIGYFFIHYFSNTKIGFLRV